MNYSTLEPGFIPSFTHAPRNESISTLGRTVCDVFLNGEFVPICSLFVPTYGFYNACLNDVADSSDVGYVEMGLIAYAQRCTQYYTGVGMYFFFF